MATPRVLRFDVEGRPLEFSVRMASEFLTAIKARYATPTTVSLGRLFLLFLFPDLASFERIADLITHLRSLDSSYRAVCTDTQLALLPPPMAITIYFIATSLPDRLASVRDALLLKHPSELTIEVLESALKDVESNLCPVAYASSVVPPPLFHGCTVPQLPTFTASLTTAATDVTAAAVTTSLRSRGRSGRRGGQGAGGGGGGGGGDVASGGGGSAGAGGAPRAAVSDSPITAGRGDAWVCQPPAGLPAAGGGAAAWNLTRRQQQQQQQQQQQPLPSQQPQHQQRQQQCFARLTDMVRLAYGVDGPAPDWLPLVQTYGPALWGMSTSQLVDLLGTPHAMYAVVDSSASDSVDSSVISLGASLAEVPVASVGTCVDTSPGAAPEDASLYLTLDSRASHCFFRDRTTLTSLPTQVSVALADPTSGPVTAHYTTTLPCPAVPSGCLTGFHVLSFSRNLVGVRPLLVNKWVCGLSLLARLQAAAAAAVAAAAVATAAAAAAVAAAAAATAPDPYHCPSSVSALCSCRSLAHPTVLWHHRMGHSSISHLCAISSQRLVLGLPRVLPLLPPSLAPPCGPSVEGRLRATPHSSSLCPATKPFETLHLDVWGPASHPSPKRESFFLVVVDDYSRYTTMFPLAKNSDETSTLIRWLLTSADTRSRCVSCLHSNRGGLVMEIARTSMTHARAPHFLWPYAVLYAAHQLNLWSRVSRPVVSPTSLWTGSPCAASRFRVLGCLALVRDTSADKILPRSVPCVFLGFPEDSSDYTFYHPPLRRFFDSRDIRFDESVPYCVMYPCRGLPVPPPSLFLTSAPPLAPPVQPSPPGLAVSDPVGAGFHGKDLRMASSRGAGVGAKSVFVRGPGSGGAGVGAEPVTAGDSSLREAGVSGAVPWGATPGGAPSAGPGEPGTDPITSSGAGSGGGATGSLESGPGATTLLQTLREERKLERQQLELQRLEEQQQQQPEKEQPQQQPQQQQQQQQPPPLPVSGLRTLGLPSPPPPSPPSPLVSGPPLPPPDPSPAVFPPPLPRCPLLFLTLGLRVALLVLVPRPLFPSPTFVLPCYYHTYRPVLSRVLASLVTDPRASLSSVTALIAAVTEFASTRCLDYATSLVAAAPTSPLAVRGESALGCDALEDRQFELEFLAATSPHLCAMLLALEGDPNALDILTPRTYAEVVSGPWASRWRAAMDSEMASYRSTGTYVKRPPGSPPVFKAHYVARDFRQREGFDFFQTFAPTLKMTTLRVLLHVAVQRDYELHSLDFSTAFLQGSLHEEVWLHRPFAFIGTFPPRTQWRLRRPVYGLRQAPRVWHDTLQSTLSDLGFQPSSADPSLFVRRGSTPFFVLVYVNDLVFATTDRVALVLQRFELQHSTLQRTPLAVDHILTGPVLDEPFEPSGPYAELVGSLIYLMTCTRPDLAFPLSILARFVAPGRHCQVHWTAAVRVAKYLATTSGMELVLGGRQDVVLTGHCDSSDTDDAETHRSTQGYYFSLGSGAVSWRFTRSSSVSTSTTEAEIYARAMAAQELRWLMFLLTDHSERPSSAPTLFTDNKATILLCREPRLESRVKHINISFVSLWLVL
ncbi:unnamed protein product [Closterium sp. NIES-53]